MPSLPFQVCIVAATGPADFLRAQDSLIAIVRDTFRADPSDGSLFVSFNRRRDRVKLPLFDRNGFWFPTAQRTWRAWLTLGSFSARTRSARVIPGKPTTHSLVAVS